MAVTKYADGTCCISSRGASLPGRYENPETGRKAIRLPYNTLRALRDAAQERGGIITAADIERAREKK